MQEQVRCPECGAFYSKIIELIDQEAEAEERDSLKGLCKRVLQAGSKKEAINIEWLKFKAGMTLKAKVALWVVFAFVFALMVSVI
jgi:hypothetical protein